MKSIALYISLSLLLAGSVYVVHYNHSKKVFIKGYDVVSYFDNSPSEGSKKYLSNYKGLVFYFSSEKNKKKFDTAPEKYIPQYGGWCAYAMAEDGDKVSINPKSYKIVNGKLLLFYNKFGINTLKKWNDWGDDTKYMKLADQNWNKVLSSEK